MPVQGKARVGHKAPDFRCDAVVNGCFEELSLETYMQRQQWLILLFIPAAFSFVCPTEVLAFHNCIDEFIERNCAIAFVSTDSKHSLWQWQNLPRELGGLGKVRVPLLSDQSHQMSRDYGVLLEKSGMDLRGSYIIDPYGIVQQVTINNIAVGRSVLEALRLVEAYQSVMKNGALCPANWKPGEQTLDESYESRDELLSKAFVEQLLVKDLDDNTSRPFNLIMPELPYHRRQQSGPAAMSGAPASKHNGSASGHTSKQSSLGEVQNAQQRQPHAGNGVVTLDFADPLGSDAAAGSPHEFVSLDDETCHRKTFSKNTSHGHSPAATSSSGGFGQRTVDALKRIGGAGWVTPLPSPRTEHLEYQRPPHKSSASAGYFE